MEILGGDDTIDPTSTNNVCTMTESVNELVKHLKR